MNGNQDSGPNIVVLGGGTGSFTLLSSLKEYTSNITAVVNMADDGGSTGVLRDELGVLPPGDVRQCLVALSNSPKLRDLFNYRYDSGTFAGHSFGNLLLSTLEKSTGSFADAVATASDILRINGTVIPATLDNVRLRMSWSSKNFVLEGEHIIDIEHFKYDPREAVLSLTPKAHVNPQALTAINEADMILLAPGDLYTSLGPLLVVDEIGEALMNATARTIYVCNLVTKKGQTDGLDVVGHAAEIERFAGYTIIDTVLYSDQIPSDELRSRYAKKGSELVLFDPVRASSLHSEFRPGAFLGSNAQDLDTRPITSLSVPRMYIRHDTKAVVASIKNLWKEKGNS